MAFHTLKSVARSARAKLGGDRQDKRDGAKPHEYIPAHLYGYDDEERAVAAIRRVRKHTMVAHEALLSIWSQVRFCELSNLPGSLVECGVWKGGVAGQMALANMAYSKTRRPLHLFDAFDDICEPDPEKDGERALREVEEFAGRARSTLTGKMAPLTGVYDHLGGPGDEQAVYRLITQDLGYDASSVHIHKGWFQDTVPLAETGEIAILRLDGDWYESTKVCLDHLYDHVVPGGFVVVDDYGCYEGCQKAVDEFLEARGSQYLSFVNNSVRYWIKP